MEEKNLDFCKDYANNLHRRTPDRIYIFIYLLYSIHCLLKMVKNLPPWYCQIKQEVQQTSSNGFLEI